MLTEIVTRTRQSLPLLHADREAIVAAAESGREPIGFRSALAGPGLAVIAEVKRKSPSRGVIDGQLDPVAQATKYVAGGAAAVSVLTEPHYFAGSPQDLMAVRSSVPVPIIRKDFIVDSLQVAEARAMGADAILLILACLDDEEAARLMHAAEQWSLDVLVETHTMAEARRAVDLGASLIGVNNRNLATFETNLATAEAIAPTLPPDVVKVAESGIWTSADASRMANAGFDAVLVGESLVRADDPAQLIRSFVQ